MSSKQEKNERLKQSLKESSSEREREAYERILELERKVAGLENSLGIYKEESDKHEKSTHIEEYMYELNVNEKNEICCLINVHGIDHSFGITERDAKSFVHVFRMHEMSKQGS